MNKGKEQGGKLFTDTRPRLQTAIANARSGFESFDPNHPPSKKESATKVYELIENILDNSGK